MTYPEAIAYLTSLGRFGMKLGLTRTNALLEAVGNPQELFQGVHVAGTNGKGSVCAMIASILRSAGYRVGLMTKPHLISYAERIQVSQQAISELDFAALLTELQPVIQHVREQLGPPTEFEILTTAALHYFARAGIDLLVCEVGLGGRLDSTNVLDLGVSIITNIALDHTEHLGSTLEEIAAEKAGILKPGSVALTGAEPPSIGVIEAKATELGLQLLRLGRDMTVTIEDRDWSGSIATITTPWGTYSDLRVSLIGRHQAENAALAVAAIEGLRARGWDIAPGAIRAGLATTRWPGRLEVVDREPTIVLDGAHNPAGLERVLETVRRLVRGRALVVVFGAMQDKDLPAMLVQLRRLEAPVIFSGIDWHRAAKPEVLAGLYPDSAATAQTAAQALAWARDRAGGHGAVLVCGSLYLVGEVKLLLRLEQMTRGLRPLPASPADHQRPLRSPR